MSHPEDWIERTKIAASYIEPNSYVVDFGSGPDNRLQQYLPPGCFYTPFDIEHPTEQFRFDVESEDWSAVPQNYDCAVIVGLIEYLEHAYDFLSKIKASVIVLTYAPNVAFLDENFEEEVARRKAAGWKTHHSFEALADNMQALGYELDNDIKHWNEQVACKFVRRSN